MEIFISINFVYIRKKNMLSRKEFAQKHGVSYGAQSTYEQGVSLPPIDFIQAICKEYEISIDDFVNVDLSKRPEVRRDYVEDKTAAPLPVSIEDLYKKTIAALESSLQSRDGVIEEKERIIQMLEKEKQRLEALLNQNGKGEN